MILKSRLVFSRDFFVYSLLYDGNHFVLGQAAIILLFQL